MEKQIVFAGSKASLQIVVDVHRFIRFAIGRWSFQDIFGAEFQDLCTPVEFLVTEHMMKKVACSTKVANA